MSIRQLRKRVKEYYGLKTLPDWSKSKRQRPANVFSLKEKDRGRWTRSQQLHAPPRQRKSRWDEFEPRPEFFEKYFGRGLG